MRRNIVLQAVAGEDEKSGGVGCVCVCVCVFTRGATRGNEMISKSYQEKLRWHIGIHYQAAFNQETQ